MRQGRHIAKMVAACKRLAPGRIIREQHGTAPAHSPAVVVCFQLVRRAWVQAQRLAQQLTLQGTIGGATCCDQAGGGWQIDNKRLTRWVQADEGNEQQMARGQTQLGKGGSRQEGE